MACAAGVMLMAASGAARPADEPVPQDPHALPQVQVNGSKLDERTLDRAAMQFVESHAAASSIIHQMGRWRAAICPQVTGLAPAAGTYVSNHVEEVARSVGAPAPRVGKKCTVNVEIVFTPEPQKLLDHVAKVYPVMLGSSRSAGDTAFSRAIQAWYLTGTRAAEGLHLPADQSDAVLFMALFDPSQLGRTENPDPPYGSGSPPSGMTGSYFTKGLVSDLLHVFVIVDTGKVAGDPLRSISDYVAMLTLTRMSSLDGCSTLPSIIDLLSSGCAAREKPTALTDSDAAYLKALYSSNLEANLNLEEGDMRDRMVKVLGGK